MSFKLSSKSMANMEGIDIRLIDIAQRAITLTPIDFGIPSSGGKRTAEEQNQLFKSGVSKADGYVRQSKHQEGKALDFYAYVDGSASWDLVYLAQIACAFLQAAIELGHQIEWGGLWKSFQDSPHVQIRG